MSTFPTIPPSDSTPLAAVGVSPSAPQIVTRLPGPKAEAWLARDRRVMSPSYTRMYPLVVARGYGSTIEDVDGNRFLDFTAGIAVTSTGHCASRGGRCDRGPGPEVDPHVGDRFLLFARDRIGRAAGEIAPGATPKRVFFTNSGTESIEAALKLARYHTGRPQRDRVSRGVFTVALTDRCRWGRRRRFIGAVSGRFCPASIICLTTARAAISTSCSPRLSRLRRSRPFSSSRFRAKGAIACRRPAFCPCSARSAIITTSCW